MNREQVIQAYAKAYNQGFITDVIDCECNSECECEDCPAGRACSQLAYNPLDDCKDYSIFKKNWAIIEDEVREAIDD